MVLRKLANDGYVYVLSYRNGKEDLTKVGTTINPERRIESIKNALPRRAKLKVVMKMRVFAPREKEGKIHARYYRKRTRPRGAGASAGATEFFKLSRTDKLWIYFYLWIQSFVYWVILGSIFLLITAAFISFFSQIFIN